MHRCADLRGNATRVPILYVCLSVFRKYPQMLFCFCFLSFLFIAAAFYVSIVSSYLSLSAIARELIFRMCERTVEFIKSDCYGVSRDEK